MGKYLCLSVLLVGLSAAERPNLNGTWVLDATQSQVRSSKIRTETLEIQQKDNFVEISDEINTGGTEGKSEYRCPTDGSMCKTKDLSVMLYYDGPALIVVEMRQNNKIVIQKRLTLSEDGKTLSTDLSHIAPTGLKGESLKFMKEK